MNPAFASAFVALGINTATGFLDLPGEVVSGHPDRHVVRVVLPGFRRTLYLKRQHRVGWRERLRSRVAGFGWSSRCEREAEVLKQLAAAGLPGPNWAAFGSDRQGRAFLLVVEAEGRDLREVLSDTALSPRERRALATTLGRWIALLHASGFTTPDLTAKHVIVSNSLGITLLDWQSARRAQLVALADRVRCLAALHASVADTLATPRERLRVLRSALGPAREAGLIRERLSDLARHVLAAVARLGDRRSIRDQRQGVVTPAAQRLVWVAGEAVCAVPAVASDWPKPAIAKPFYGCEPGTLPHTLPGGGEAVLIRGRSVSPLARGIAWLRGRLWRSPGVTLGRVLFHLERYGIPAPRLLAFGQRLTGPFTAEWFALHTQPVRALSADPDVRVAELLGRRLRQLHDAGCRPVGEPLAVWGLGQVGVEVRAPTAIRLVKRLTLADRESDLAELILRLSRASGAGAEAGYRSAPVLEAEWRGSRTAGLELPDTMVSVS